jgi:adenosine deaminase
MEKTLKINFNMTQTFSEWISALPKAELHLHIDGTLQAHRMLSLAQKNAISLPYKTVEDVEKAYEFEDLQSFLDLYYLGASVLIDEEDFYHLMFDYLLKCKEQNIVHTEIMVEPQTYAPNGVSFATMMTGFKRAIEQARLEWGQSVLLILSFLRHLSEADALVTLKQAKDFRDDFVAVGLASAELGNPPEKFESVFAVAREQGYLVTVHAGEEGPAAYIWDSLGKLKANRIDHGVRCVEDHALLTKLADQKIALTVCPLSNIKLCVYQNMREHAILKLLEMGIPVTVNSDDPAYFDGYLNENFVALYENLGLSDVQAIVLIENSFKYSFLSDSKKHVFLGALKNSA